jgi:hypothetical protein
MRELRGKTAVISIDLEDVIYQPISEEGQYLNR